MRDLRGLRILLTRSPEGCGLWAERIEAASGRPLQLPCIRTELLDTPELRESLDAAVGEACWIALSSPRGVEGLAALLPALPDGVRVAAVGPATAAACTGLLGRADLVAPDGTAASLAEALLGRPDGPGEGATVLTVAAAGGRRDIEEALERAGVPVRRIEVYRTTWEPDNGEPRHSLAGEVDVVLLASPSAVRGLLARADVDDTIEIITIGPTTTAAARELGLRVTAEAGERSLDGMLEAIP